METRFVIRNSKEIQAFLKELPRGTLRVALEAMALYFLGDSSHGLKHNDPYKYVTRKRAYGVTFFSPAQRAYVMGKIRSGEITPGTPNRTGKTAAAWEAIPTNNGYGYSLVNETRGAYYTRSDKGQARQPALVGWRKASKVVTDNMRGAIRSAISAVNKWIKENKPK